MLEDFQDYADSNESVMDYPKDGLCLEIWDLAYSKDGIGMQWRLNSYARQKIMDFLKQLLEKSLLPMPKTVHITGSITSNSYTDNADIDIHLLGFDDLTDLPDDEIQNRLTQSLKDIREDDPDSTYIGTHPFEVYYQTSEFQDFMSVGCYSLFDGEWLVGPELSDKSFDPYSEYYKDIQAKSEEMLSDIRSILLKTYEKSVVCMKMLQNPNDVDQHSALMLAQQLDDLDNCLREATDLFDQLRASRKAYSSPQSMEQALEYRSSKKWKIADASFKLIDKYGYTAILREFKTILQMIDDGIALKAFGSTMGLVQHIMKTVKQYIANEDKLAEEDDQFDKLENHELEYGKTIAYHVSNVPPEKIKREGFKAGQGNGATDTNLFDDLYEVDYPKNYLFVSKEPWDVDHPDKYRYCYKIDITGMDFYPDFGMLNYFGAYHEEGSDEEGQVFWWKDKDLKFMKNQKLKALVMKQGGQLTTNEMMGGETVDGEYFPDALYDALGSAVIDGDVVNRENRILDVEIRDLNENGQEVEKYDPPYTLEQIKANYPEDIYNQLSKCPIHRWRAETGIELVHKEPTKEELERIWKNWNLMNQEQKEISDQKSIELFGMNNEQHYRELCDQQLDEGLGEAVGSFALACAVFIPGQVSAKTISNAQNKLSMSTTEIQMRKNEFQNRLSILDLSKKYGKYDSMQAINIFALTLFGEGRDQIKNGGIDLITDSIINRCYNGNSDIPGVCLGRAKGKAFQYSYWNKNQSAINMIDTGQVVVPDSIGNAIERKAWDFCIKRAIDVISGVYKSSNADINSYYVTDMKNPPKWAKLLTKKQVKGDHTFGYLKTNDPKYVDMTNMTARLKQQNGNSSRQYVIKSGDTLWNIAKVNNTTVKALAAKNNIDPNAIIKPGQKILI